MQLATAVRLNSVHRHLRTGHKGHSARSVKYMWPAVCVYGKLKRGHCKGDSSNVCCVKSLNTAIEAISACMASRVYGLPSACTGGELTGTAKEAAITSVVLAILKKSQQK